MILIFKMNSRKMS